MNWYLDVLKKYAVFSGRARRTEYWMFVLFNIIISIVLSFIGGVIGIEILGILYALAVVCPAIGVTIRRLQDTERSGWWILLQLLPIVGAIVLIVFLAQEGTAGDNKYGPNPKAA